MHAALAGFGLGFLVALLRRRVGPRVLAWVERVAGLGLLGFGGALGLATLHDR